MQMGIEMGADALQDGPGSPCGRGEMPMEKGFQMGHACPCRLACGRGEKPLKMGQQAHMEGYKGRSPRGCIKIARFFSRRL